MTQPQDIEQLERDLADLGAQLMVGRERVRPRLEVMIHRTRRLLSQAGHMADARVLTDIHERLLSYQRGFEVDDTVKAARAASHVKMHRRF